MNGINPGASSQSAPPTCTRVALYTAPDGSVTRLGLPEGVTPQGIISVYGRARTLLDVIAADDPRTDDEVLIDAIRRLDGELAALLEDAA